MTTCDKLTTEITEVIDRLKSGDWLLEAEHTSGKAPSLGDKWSDPQEWEMPIPDDPAWVADRSNVSAHTNSSLEDAATVVCGAVLQELYAIRDADHADTPDSAITDMVVNCVLPDGRYVFDDDGNPIA